GNISFPSDGEHTPAGVLGGGLAGEDFVLGVHASALTPGQYYKVCVDVDGAGAGSAFEDTNLRVFTLGASTEPVAMEGSGLSWSFPVDARSLVAGLVYRICTDLDGDAQDARPAPSTNHSNGTLPAAPAAGLSAGDTGLTVYVSGVQGLGVAAVRRGSAEVVPLSCLAGCVSDPSIPAYTAVYLATACDSSESDGDHSADANLSTASAFLSAATEAELDTSNLTVGSHYVLCADMDGAGPLAFGSTGLQVYVIGDLNVEQGTVFRGPLQNLTLTCTSGCSGASTGYLGTSCDSAWTDGVRGVRPGRATASRSFQDVGSNSTWPLTLDTTYLESGRYYRICVDLDGQASSQSYGDSSLQVYVSPVASLQSQWTLPSIVAPVVFTCAASWSADAAPATNATTGSSSWWGFTFGNGSSNTSLSGLAHSVVPCSEATTAYLATSCDGSVAGGVVLASGAARTSSAHLVAAGAFVAWPGVSLLGDGSLAASREVGLFEDRACASAALARGYPYWTRRVSDGACWPMPLASLAGAAAAAGFTSGPVEVAGWLLTVDASGLLPGGRYALCLDADGLATTRSFGDTSLRVYVSPVALVENTTVQAVQNQVLSLTCSSCSNNTAVMLASDCYAAALSSLKTGVQTMSATLASIGTGQWAAALDATPLTLGLSYQLCIDVDGDSSAFGLGESGYSVYVSPLASASTSVLAAGSRVLNATCPEACSSSTYAWLAQASCGSRDLATRAMRFLGGVPYYFFEVDAGSLTAGELYRLCVDIDIDSDASPVGDTGLTVYASVIQAATLAIRPEADQAVVLTTVAGYTAPGDATGPVIVSSAPAYRSANLSRGETTVNLTFDENVVAGSGDVAITAWDDSGFAPSLVSASVAPEWDGPRRVFALSFDTAVQAGNGSFSVRTAGGAIIEEEVPASRVVFHQNMVIIQPSSPLPGGAEYCVVASSQDAVVSTSGVAAESTVDTCGSGSTAFVNASNQEATPPGVLASSLGDYHCTYASGVLRDVTYYWSEDVQVSAAGSYMSLYACVGAICDADTAVELWRIELRALPSVGALLALVHAERQFELTVNTGSLPAGGAHLGGSTVVAAVAVQCGRRCRFDRMAYSRGPEEGTLSVGNGLR
ncbi:unnamed protein product, partial [Prorocentrum cordatum]